MKSLIVAGNIFSGKASSVADVLAHFLGTRANVCNGVLPDNINGFDLVIWAPDIRNEQPKNYPKKDMGAVLICSKVMREGLTEVDAVTRIFTMHANAVICIYKNNPIRFRFKLIDALGNTWSNSHSIEALALDIKEFYQWSKGQVRMSFAPTTAGPMTGLELPVQLIRLNTMVADKVENSLGARYFGNFSTRCMKLFPSARGDRPHNYLFSPRNVDKKRITKNDFVHVIPPHYYGNRKYSVDAPCQVQLYQQFDDINFMIHGHATLTTKESWAGPFPTTGEYYPCGDLREVEEIAKIFRKGHRAINLKNHGFLLAYEDLDTMKRAIHNINFVVEGLT